MKDSKMFNHQNIHAKNKCFKKTENQLTDSHVILGIDMVSTVIVISLSTQIINAIPFERNTSHFSDAGTNEIMNKWILGCENSVLE